MSIGARILPLLPHTPVTPRNEERREAEAAAAAAPGGRARTRTREALADLADYYCQTFDRRTCAPCVARELAAALEAGMEPETVCMAMDAAMSCERPSWAYASAVIRGCLADNALTPDAFRERSRQHQARKPQRRAEAQPFNYQQREYKPGDLDHVYVDWQQLAREEAQHDGI